MIGGGISRAGAPLLERIQAGLARIAAPSRIRGGAARRDRRPARRIGPRRRDAGRDRPAGSDREGGGRTRSRGLTARMARARERTAGAADPSNCGHRTEEENTGAAEANPDHQPVDDPLVRRLQLVGLAVAIDAPAGDGAAGPAPPRPRGAAGPGVGRVGGAARRRSGRGGHQERRGGREILSGRTTCRRRSTTTSRTRSIASRRRTRA